MTYVYFFYGLSFFTLGISIIFYPKKGSEFRIAKTLVFIALFGIIHGIHEWAEMFDLMRNPAEITALKSLCLVLLPLSYFCLITFGIKSTLGDKVWSPVLSAVPTGLLVLWIILTATANRNFLMGDIWARYLLGIPATVLTGYALLGESAHFRQTRTHISKNLTASAYMFFLYGILTGLVVPDADFFPASVINYTLITKTLGIPVQVFRTVCAIVITYNVVSILRLFAWETQERLRNLSLKDELTGLLNRRGFFTLAEQQIKIAKRQNRTLLLIIGDIDNLKQINDTLGHMEGDAALIESAAILRESFRQSDIIARMGGDEFAILQVGNTDGNEKPSIDRLRNNVALHNEQSEREYRLSLSVGTSLWDPSGSHSISELVKQADDIMYEQKKSKKNQSAS